MVTTGINTPLNEVHSRSRDASGGREEQREGVLSHSPEMEFVVTYQPKLVGGGGGRNEQPYTIFKRK